MSVRGFERRHYPHEALPRNSWCGLCRFSNGAPTGFPCWEVWAVGFGTSERLVAKVVDDAVVWQEWFDRVLDGGLRRLSGRDSRGFMPGLAVSAAGAARRDSRGRAIF